LQNIKVFTQEFHPSRYLQIQIMQTNSIKFINLFIWKYISLLFW